MIAPETPAKSALSVTWIRPFVALTASKVALRASKVVAQGNDAVRPLRYRKTSWLVERVFNRQTPRAYGTG
jgi:hypothetical protein